MHYLYQEQIKEYIQKKLGNEQWITVYGRKTFHECDYGFGSGLLPKDELDNAMNHCSWDHSFGAGIPGFVQSGNDTYYEKYEDSGHEMLVIERDFHGIYENYADISQEFILLFNLHFDSRNKIYSIIKENGEVEEVIRINDKYIDFNKKYLMMYAAAKQKYLMLYFDVRANANESLNNIGVPSDFFERMKIGNIYYEYWVGQLSFSSNPSSYSVLMGKKVLPLAPVESCGLWPYEKDRKYQDYVIGIDEEGKEVFHTSNPDSLNNYFGLNPDSPHYLTPVFFKREVLQKYYSNPSIFSISDGYLRCQGLWGLYIDNHNPHYLSVYLGDLGRDLPEDEQIYWKSFNILIDGQLSDVKFKRDFLSLFTDATIADLRFKAKYLSFCDKWEIKHSWSLFQELSPGDKYVFDLIHLPLQNTQNEFDNQVSYLVKLMIDSINVSHIKKLIEDDTSNINGSITLIELWLKNQLVLGYEEHINFLRNLQELRSTGTAHRKGKNYEKIIQKINPNDNGFIAVTEEILNKMIAFLIFMEASFLEN